jgi:DNA (cytosine-5)-methyltransferase 1
VSVRSIELFAGAGGLGIGVSRAGFTSAAVVEWDKYACDTIRENQAAGIAPLVHWPLIQGDVRDLRYGRYEREGIDLVSGGPPCQPFSMGGKHRGRLDERDMFPEAVRAIRRLRPKAFIFENVRGLTRQSFRNYFEYIRLLLMYPGVIAKADEDWDAHLVRLERYHTTAARRGHYYRLVTRVLDAADYGVPQRRHRVFFVGFRADLDIEWSFPEPTHSADALLWEKFKTGSYWEKHGIAKRARPKPSETERARVERLGFAMPPHRPWHTVRDALSDLPDPEREPSSAGILNHQFNPGARAYPGHTGSPLDEPAKALKAGDHGVPGGENMLVRDDGSLRYFSVRESARLQTFPDDFRFHGSWTEIMRQLGNAVPVTLAEVVARSVMAKLERVGG